MSRDMDVERLLRSALADEPPAGDPVAGVRAAVRRRARRQRLAAGSGALAGVAILAVGVALAAPDGGTDRLTVSDDPTPTATATRSPDPSATATPSGSAAPTTQPSGRPTPRATSGAVLPPTHAAPRPYVRVTTREVSNSNGTVGWVVHLHGLVPAVVDGRTGQVHRDATTLLRRTRISYGDGGTGGSDGAFATCTGTPLVPFDYTSSVSHAYRAPGTYRMVFTATFCGLGDVQDRTSVSVQQPPHLTISTAFDGTSPGAPVNEQVGVRSTLLLTITGVATGSWPVAVDWGDGTRDVPASVGSHCEKAPRPVSDLYRYPHTWTRPGTYTVSVSAGTCGTEATGRVLVHVALAPGSSQSPSPGASPRSGPSPGASPRFSPSPSS